MTTPSSNKKSPFVTYFGYRMRRQFHFLIVTLMLNVLGIGVFSAASLARIKIRYTAHTTDGYSTIPYELGVLTEGLVMISAIAVLALSLFGAISAFDYCLKNDHTDTFYGLPVTLRGRFWADFLSGYISHVASLLPCSVFSMIVSVSADDLYNKLSLVTTNTDQSGFMIKVFAELNLALFFTYTFAYVLSVIITVCCGRISSSVVFTSLCAVIPLILCGVTGGYVLACRIGVSNFNQFFPKVLGNTPPVGTFFIKVKDAVDTIYGKTDPLYEVTSPMTYVIYSLVIAALIAAAYFIFKRRRPENTGRRLAVRSFYYVFSGIVAFSLICMICLITYSKHMWWLSALISAAAAGIALLIFTLASRRERSDFKKNMIRSLAVIAGSIVLLVIVDKTGAFGTRYYNTSPDKTQSINIIINDYSQANYFRENFTIEDRADIEKFISSLNNTLKNRSDELTYGSCFVVTYNLTNGQQITRRYDSGGSSSEQRSAVEELFGNVRSLPSYPKISSESISESIYQSTYAEAVIHDKFGKVIIPKDHIPELADILSREVLEKYDNNAQLAGLISVDSDKYGSMSIPISSSFTDTISFVESFREYDEDAVAFSMYIYSELRLTLDVKMKNVNNDAEKELFSLLKETNRNVYYFDARIRITSSNGLEYYVPEENKERVIDLVLTIIEKNYTQ